MKVDETSIKKTQELLKDLSKCENALDVLKNYDAKVYLYFYTTGHNHNRKDGKSVNLLIDDTSLKEQAITYVNQKVAKIKRELEEL